MSDVIVNMRAEIEGVPASLASLIRATEGAHVPSSATMAIVTDIHGDDIKFRFEWAVRPDV